MNSISMTQSSNPEPARHTRRPRILVVDDQAINVQTLYQTFSADHQVFMATSGEQALAVSIANQPDVILLDIVMPDMDGYEVLRRIKAHPDICHIPVIFISASPDDTFEVRGLNAGAVDFIFKPINPQVVRARVKIHLTLLEQQLALQDSEQYTRAIVENAADGIIVSDESGYIQSANHAVSTIFGHQAADLIGANIKILLSDPQRDEFRNYYSAHCLEQKIIPDVIKETEGKHQDGHVFPIELALSTKVYRNHAIVVILIRDISERRRVEKMKTDFISTVSHELRTPLTSISGALGLMVGGALGNVPDNMQTMLSMAHQNSLRLSTLINDLLEMDKMLAGKMQFDFKVQALMPIIENAVDSVHAYAQRFNVSYRITDKVDDVLVNVDANRLLQVLVNLLSNAAKYSPAHGQVEITVAVEASKLRICVIDHGSGIPLAFQQHVFQKFSQADSSNNRGTGGTGLGLAIAQEMISHMHGSIGFTTEIDVGSCFYIVLPVAS